MPIQTGAILPRGAPSEDDDKLDWTDRVMRRWQRNPPNPQGGGDFPDASEEGMHSHDLLQGSNPREVISPDTEQPSSGIIRASGKAASADGFSFDEALKPAGDAGFSFDDALKPAQKPSTKDDGLPWDVPMTGAQMRQSQEQIRKGEEKIAANEPEPGLEHLLTGPARIAQRGGQQLLGERPLPTGVEALEEASLGVRPSKFTSATPAPGTSAPRIEPRVPGGGDLRWPPPEPPSGFTLEEAGITPTPESPAPGFPRLPPSEPGAPKPGSATLEEAGIRPTPEPTPAPATETETVAVPQADGTVRRVQVKTGEPPPPPSEPPTSAAAEAPSGSMNPADLRAGFPDLSDEQFEALFQQANREVPRPTSIDPADQGAWMKAVMGTMARLSGSSTSTTAPAADPWAPVAVAPSDQPDAETPIQQTSPTSAAAPETQQPASAAAPEAQKPTPPEEVPASDLKPGDKVMLGDAEHEVEAVRPWTGDQVGVKLKDDPKLHIGPADAPVRKAPSSEAALAAEPIPVPLTNLEGIHNGPWTAVGKNYIGDTVFENASGVRAIMDGNVPYTESTTEHPEKGRVPKNAGDRKRQFLIEGEKWADEKPVAPAAKPAAKPRKPAEKPQPTAAASIPEIGGISESQDPVTENVSKSGQKRIEIDSVPTEAHPDSTPAEVPIDEPPDELRGALNTLSGGRTLQTPTGEVPPAEEPPEELQGQSTGYKPRREYNKHLTNQAEIAANKLIVDAPNGDIPEKNAIAGLGELVRRGGLSEGAARANLSRLNDWNEGKWEAAKSAPAAAAKAEEAAEAETTKPVPTSFGVAEQQVKKSQAALPGYDSETGKMVDPDAVFADILANSLEDPNHVITASKLQSAAQGIYGGTLADGTLKRDRLYDAIELGVNTFIARHPERFAPTGDLEPAKAAAAELAALKDRIPTQTVRAGDKEKLQQFSTPPDYAFAVAWAANLKPGEVVIEPSAGTGGIAVHAINAGAQVIGNEISPQRRAMMETLPFSRITKENAEQLHNILPRDIKPTAVVMNPPFSSAGDRMGGKMMTEIGAVHIEQALKRLESGGRLVAIVGDGMKPEGAATAGKGGRNNATGATFRDWWKKIGAEYDVRANIGVGGEIYRKYGTTFPTRLLVIDKVAPSGQPPVVTTVITSAELLDALSGVRDARPGSAREPVADQSGSAGVVDEGQGESRPGETVRPPVGDVGVGVGQDGPSAAARPKPARTGGRKAGDIRTDKGQRASGGVRSDAPSVQQPEPLPQGGAGQPGEQPVSSQVPGGSGAGGDTSHLRPDGSDLAVTPPAPELLETSIIVPEEQTGGELSESVYEDYRPQRISIEGAQPHPGPLVQSAAMASVLPPAVTYKPHIPKSLIEAGELSAPQLEAITYAGAAHAQMLEKDAQGIVKRRGYFIGDGTGVGKGREVAGIILDNKWQGRKKAIWVSEKMPLSNDAKRDWTGLGQPASGILTHNKVKAGDEIKHDGILFTTYDTVKSGEKFGGGAELTVGSRVAFKTDNKGTIGKGTIHSTDDDGKTWVIAIDEGNGRSATVPAKDIALEGAEPKTRVQQIVDWVGKDFDGVIAFDEAHNMANITGGTGTRGKKEAAGKALAGLELQNTLPNARVVYVSATGATEVSNLAYADRLGLWGPGTAFADRSDFLSRVSSGGVAAMELVARDMKALGYYTARSLSYDGVEYDRVQHDLTPPQRVMYDKIAEAWQIVLRDMMAALAETGAEGKGGPKSAILSAFWGGHQRFFNQLITSLQMPSVIRGIDKDIAEGRQAVLQLVNTNEAGQERALDKSKARGDEDLEELDMSPRDQLLQLVEKAYPIRQYETYLDDEGNERVRPVSDSEGNPVFNQEATAARDKLLLDLGSLRVPDGPLEILVNHYGPEAVAEVTGRKQRVVNRADETGRMKKVLEKRSADANVAEANSFQGGKKKILIFSQAGGTGRSYHDDKTAQRVDEVGRLGNGARRSHYLVQAGWRADTAVQGFGRTHRTNQWTAPIFHLVTTDLEGQKRFISSIARRLGQLGALTKGERRTGDQGMFGLQDNLESDEARAGLVQLFRDIHGGRVEGFSEEDLAQQMGLFISTPDGALKDELPPMTQFLNRVLSLKVQKQNQVFNEFATRFRDIVDRAAEAGTLDAGTETYKADKITKARDQVVYTDPNSGAETRHVHLKTHNRNYPASFNDVMSGKSNMTGWRAPEFFVQNKRSGYISAVTPTTFTKVDPDGSVTEHYRVSTPLDWQYVPKDELNDSMRATGNLNRVTNLAEAKTLWDDRVAKTPEFREADLHIITGAILPIWDRLSGQPKIFRLQTDSGERMLGRVVDNKVINQTLERLGAEGVKLNVKPSDVVDRIMDGGVANLANGWTIKRRRVANESRLELTGTDLYSHTGELEAAGVFRERIPGSYDTRYFIPSGANGAGVIEAITKRRPIISLEGD